MELLIEANDTINLTIIAQIGTGSSQPIFTFSDQDQYMWERDSKHCDGTGNEGAPNIIERTIMFGLCPAPPPNCRYWFPKIFEVTYNALDYEVDEVKDNWCDYKIFYVSGTIEQVFSQDVMCLGIDTENHPYEHELSFYSGGLYEIVSQSLTNTLMQCQLIEINSFLYTLPMNKFALTHVPSLFYGHRMIINYYDPNYPKAISIE